MSHKNFIKLYKIILFYIFTYVIWIQIVFSQLNMMILQKL